ncbi:uncharacterized protein LOC125063336 isoform X1 [Pieris napi]|uniref:uncharacterized protein LOC125063336 isoform X1 n=1 Tax=Pieris napi TaxID=78633 RepID=UPI001FBA15D0|nr:uncharacterized protein LOC125063336 isoform X1 [Pieris napi]
MESHVLNVYHHARYRTIDHKIMRTTSESLSSEGSCDQNSPEYPQDQASSQHEESNEGEYWNNQNRNLWSQNQKINITKSHDSSIDEEEIDVQEVSIDERIDSSDNEVDPDSAEDTSLVEGADYDVIQVFAVDPDLDLEGSSEDEELEPEHDDEHEDEDEEEYLNSDDKSNYTETDNSVLYHQNPTDNICEGNLDINLDASIVSNVDEYFIEEKDILAVKDEPVVKDVDEYFIKNVKELTQPTIEEDFLIPEKLPDESDFRIQKNVPDVEEFFAIDHNDDKSEIINVIIPDPETEIEPEVPINETEIEPELPINEIEIEPELPINETEIEPELPINETEIEPELPINEPEIESELPINETDLAGLPNIEDLKRYLLEDMPYNKLKNAQRSCSVPHSPMHNLCLDIDSKTCLSFEDLNLDLSDLSFDNCKDKSNNSSKSDDIPQTLTEEDVNSFLITSSCAPSIKNQDDLKLQDMEIDKPVETIMSEEHTKSAKTLPIEPNATYKSSLNKIPAINSANIQDQHPELKTSNIKQEPISHTKLPKIPLKSKLTVFDFCIEKNVKKERDVENDIDDFVDVESCNDSVIPVLEANNLNSLLEQFEATEKLNKKKEKIVKVETTVKSKPITSLTNGMRLQDAGIQLNKNKMRQILMPSTINTTARRSPSPVHSDHDYCTTKKRHSLPNITGGRSLLKPEVLSSNNKILSSRHRSCKNKKIVYHQSSDEESEKCNASKKKVVNNRVSDDDSDIRKKCSSKETLKVNANINSRKKVSPVHFVSNCSVDKNNGSVMVKNASKASDTASSQNSNGSLKLTIKNKCEVIIRHGDAKELDKTKSSIAEKSLVNTDMESFEETRLEKFKHASEKSHGVIEKIKQADEKTDRVAEQVKQEHSKADDFYVTLFKDKKDVQVPQNITKNTEKRSHDDVDQVSHESTNGTENEIQPQKKKKLNLQEYKLRRENNNSNQSSAQVSPEAIFPEMPGNIILDKPISSSPRDLPAAIKPASDEHNKATVSSETSKKIFDPIREASRKILMNTKKLKAEAIRKRDEDFIMSKIPKVENLELQPLISDAEMLKIVNMSANPIISIPIPKSNEAYYQPPKNYDEIIVVSMGTNTDEKVFKVTESIPEIKRHKPLSPAKENKSTINFKIKKSDNILKHNVFESMKTEHSPKDDQTADIKIDEERYKGIAATLKSVGKQVDTKISSNSLFASIQDVVRKKATNAHNTNSHPDHKQKLITPVHKLEFVYPKPIIVRDYDENADHGEDKIILHLEKGRTKPETRVATVQTACTEVYKQLTLEVTEQKTPIEQTISPRKRNDSDMSMSSEGSPERKLPVPKTENKRQELKRERSPVKEKRSRSKDRHEIKYRRSRSHSRGHRRHRSRTRTRSRSRGRYKRYRRSDSPYRRKRRSRSPYRSPLRREYRSVRSGSRYAETKSSIAKKSPQKIEKKTKSLTPPIRKPTVSESSDTTTSSSSSSRSNTSGSSSISREATSTFRGNNSRATVFRNSYSSEDRESNTPVEERRIVFVGRLEQDINKSLLRSQFSKFGPVTEVRLHSKEDGSRYGFVTYQRPRDAWTAVEAASSFPQYDVGFGGRRAFCRQSYADLDGLEAKYTECAFHGQASAPPPRRSDDMSFEQMLLDIKKKLNNRKGDKRAEDSA